MSTVAVPIFALKSPLLRRHDQAEILNLIFSQIPIINEDKIYFNAFAEFVSDPETQTKRQRLFSLANDFEVKMHKDDFNRAISSYKKYFGP